MRFNTNYPPDIDRIYFDDTDLLGSNQAGWYDTFDDTIVNSGLNRGYIYVTSVKSSGNTSTIFYVDGSVTNNNTYWTVPVTYVSGNLPSNGEKVTVLFTKTGIQGLQGSQGLSNQGTQGLSGSDDVSIVILSMLF